MAFDDTNLEQGILGTSHWVKRWAEGDISDFHRDAAEPLFEAYADRMFGGTKKRIFVPLCGKSPDLLWMHWNGHTVVGVEVAEQACRELFTESSTAYSVEAVGDVNVYKSKDERLTLYAANIFELTADSLGTYDLIWDSRSLISINKNDQQKYSRLMKELMKPNGEMFLKVMEYDESVWPGPPHSINPQLVQDLYGDQCSVELLQEKPRHRPNVTDKSNARNTETANTGSGELSQPCLEQPKPTSLGEAMKTSSFITDRFFVITKN